MFNSAAGTNTKVLLGMEYKHIDILLYGLIEAMGRDCLVRPYMSLEELREIEIIL